MKHQRQATILELVDRGQVGRQAQLRERLQALGFDVTQATLSRDIKELGLVKRAADGTYQRPDRADSSPVHSREHALAQAVADYLSRIDVVRELIVLRTDPGEAQPLARAIDRADLPEIAGTIGGDDTILVVARDTTRAKELVDRFRAWSGRQAVGGPRARVPVPATRPGRVVAPRRAGRPPRVR